MAIENIPVNSGTGPKVAVDLVGTDNYQIVKVVQAGDGSAGTLSNVFSVTSPGTVTVTAAGTVAVTAANVTVATIATGTVSVINTPVVTATISNNPLIVTAANITVATIATGTVSVINTPIVTATVTSMPVLSATNVTIASVTAITPFQAGGSVIASGTGTGPLIMGIQSGATFAKPILVHTTGGLVIAAMPAVGGGQQYSAGATDMGATATGMVLIGVQSGATTGRALLVSTTGGLIVDAYTVTNIGTITTLLGTVAVSGGGGGVQYSIGDTTMAATGTGTIMLAMQSGATTARSIAITTTGAVQAQLIGTSAVTAANVTIASVTTGTFTMAAGTVTTVLAMPVLSATGVTVASVTAHGFNVVGGGIIASGTGTGPAIMGMQSGATLARPILVTTTGSPIVTLLGTQAVTAANITVASITTGTVSVAGTVSTVSTVGAIVGVVTVTASANPLIVSTVSTLLGTVVATGGFVGTAHASRWDAYVVNTSSGLAVIVKTSGAHTLYITDLMISVDVPMQVTVFSSSATAKATVYLATKGGLVFPMKSPMVLNSAQSLCFCGSATGSVSCYAAGYTVT